MSSLLTGTNKKSIYLYFIFFIITFSYMSYFYLIKKPNIKEYFEEKVFHLNYLTFKNSIYLSNIKYISSSKKVKIIDVWKPNNKIINQEGLDYNSFGFPIGTTISRQSRETPLSVENCLQVWNFLMESLQSQITHKKNSYNYWAELTEDNQCSFHSPNNSKHKIIYDSRNGDVILFTIKSK